MFTTLGGATIAAFIGVLALLTLFALSVIVREWRSS